MPTMWKNLVGVALGVILIAPMALAQSVADTAAGPLMAERPALESRLEAARMMGEAGSEQAELIERRLTNGDFRQGDRVLLEVQSEPALTDTFTVNSGLELLLPDIGAISLRGVLRSELESHLRDELSQYLRVPVVRARALVGLTVVGEVAHAGVHWVPSDALVTDVLTAAGGGTRDAKINEMRIERRGQPVLNEKAMQAAMASMATLDDVGVLPGDQLIVPSRSGVTTYEIVRTVSIILTIPLTIYALTQIFGK